MTTAVRKKGRTWFYQCPLLAHTLPQVLAEISVSSAVQRILGRWRCQWPQLQANLHARPYLTWSKRLCYPKREEGQLVGRRWTRTPGNYRLPHPPLPSF